MDEKGTQARVKGWLDDVGVSYGDGGVTGPALAWSLSIAFGGATHVSVAHDTRYPRRLEVMSDLAIAEDHQRAYARLANVERETLDRRLVQVLLRRSGVNFQMVRDAMGALEKVAMRAYLPVEHLTPAALTSAIYDVRNTTMDLCVAFQDTLGAGGVPLDRALTEEGYTNVILQMGTLETLGAFQIPGETLDETILRAVRE
ncbi:MAG TPA: DUF2299 family protein [Candidatus Thermoplasmatota archaeon]|nr:DUF2299 family protein [Candidatus Thermoplasmatota archaeon]